MITLIAAGLKARTRKKPLNVIAFENSVDAGPALRAAVAHRVRADARACRLTALWKAPAQAVSWPVGGAAIAVRRSRIVAVADVFDALTTNKVYRPAVPMTKAIEIMKSERGKHFDPTLLDVFLGERGRILGIKERFADLDRDDEDINPLSALVADL